MAQLDTGTNELLGELNDGVARLILNRPEKRNALSDTLTPALRECLLELDARPDCGALLLTGAGAAFCSGGDVSGMGSGTGSGGAADQSHEARVRNLTRRQETLSLRLHEFSKPTIAALPGPAAGAGLSIALACDLRLMADSAFITTAFANIALSGDYGCSWFLTRLVGPSRAKALLFTARRVSARECLELGLANEVVPAQDLASRASEFARELAQGPLTALGYMKANVNRAVEQDLRACLAGEAQGVIACAAHPDHKEAVAAFLEKRKPDFSTGRGPAAGGRSDDVTPS